MKRALVVQHVAFEDLGVFKRPVIAAGFAIDHANAWHLSDRLAVAEAADLLVVLGGPIGVYQEREYPFLTEELRLIGARLDAGLPTLGICLGAQLMAKAAGADIRPGVTEIGLAPIRLTVEGKASCLEPFASSPLAWHWHSDACDLPAGAERLAYTPSCDNQAFAFGRHALAFQFHPEFDPARIEDWLTGHAMELKAHKMEVTVLRQAMSRYRGERRGVKVISEWLRRLDEAR